MILTQRRPASRSARGIARGCRVPPPGSGRANPIRPRRDKDRAAGAAAPAYELRARRKDSCIAGADGFAAAGGVALAGGIGDQRHQLREHRRPPRRPPPAPCAPRLGEARKQPGSAPAASHRALPRERRARHRSVALRCDRRGDGALFCHSVTNRSLSGFPALQYSPQGETRHHRAGCKIL